MTTDYYSYDRLLLLLDRVMSRLQAEHNEAHDFGTGHVMHRAEIHTLQAIGDHPGINNDTLAQKMEVTKGAISQIVSKLVKKGLVIKSRLTSDGREVVLNLTDLGKTGYKNHESGHKMMFGIVKEYFGDRYEDSLKEHTKVLQELNDIMDLAEKNKL